MKTESRPRISSINHHDPKDVSFRIVGKNDVWDSSFGVLDIDGIIKIMLPNCKENDALPFLNRLRYEVQEAINYYIKEED